MGNEEALIDSKAMDSVVRSCNDGAKQVSDNINESEGLEVNFVKDFDSYMQDLSDRLTISRMVSDSVIGGMVNAFEQEAAEKIAQKELEMAKLKEMLHVYHVGADGPESSQTEVICDESKNISCVPYSTISETLMQHNRISDSLGSLRFSAKEQLKKLRKEIDCIKGSGSTRRINSGSALLGFSGILQDKASERWIDVDKMMDSLTINLDSVFEQVENIALLSKASVCEWHLEKEFQAEIEGMVIKNCFWGLKEEFEPRLWDHNALFYWNESVNWLEKIKEISSLRQELDNISNSLSLSENGQLTSRESLEISGDHFHRKVSGNHAASAALYREGSGIHEDSTTVHENLDPTQLKRLSKDDMVNFFKTEMTKMKRHHESKVQEMTEEYFSLKRDYLRERRVLRKDKECEVLKKKIREVILKLDNFLLENDKLPAFSSNTEMLDNLNGRLEFLLAQNHQLRASVTDKEKEIQCLSSQISDTAEKTSQHSLASSSSYSLMARPLKLAFGPGSSRSSAQLPPLLVRPQTPIQLRGEKRPQDKIVDGDQQQRKRSNTRGSSDDALVGSLSKPAVGEPLMLRPFVAGKPVLSSASMNEPGVGASFIECSLLSADQCRLDKLGSFELNDSAARYVMQTAQHINQMGGRITKLEANIALSTRALSKAKADAEACRADLVKARVELAEMRAKDDRTHGQLNEALSRIEKLEAALSSTLTVVQKREEASKKAVYDECYSTYSAEIARQINQAYVRGRGDTLMELNVPKDAPIWGQNRINWPEVDAPQEDIKELFFPTPT